MRSFLSNLARSTSGATTVEFAFVVGPLVLILVAGIDFGHRIYVSSIMQAALTDAARRASVEDPDLGSGRTGALEAQVKSLFEDQVKPIATPGYTLTVTQQNFFDFNDIGNPEKIVRDNDADGTYDAIDGDCFSDLNGNGAFDTDTGRDGIGGANDVVFYEAKLEMDALIPLTSIIGGKSRHTLISQAAIRNQPYDVQATPPTICGTVPS